MNPWMPFYVRDYLADTEHLTTTEHGAYMLLIMHCWQHGTIPANPQQKASVARMRLNDFNRIWPNLAPYFEADGSSRRVTLERQKIASVTSVRREAGRKGGLEKSRKYSSNATNLPVAKGVANTLAKRSYPQPYSTPLTPLASAAPLATAPRPGALRGAELPRSSPAGATVNGKTWVSSSDRQWPALSNRMGPSGAPTDSRNGWNFPTEWIEIEPCHSNQNKAQAQLPNSNPASPEEQHPKPSLPSPPKLNQKPSDNSSSWE